MRDRQRLVLALLAVPAAVLAASYAWLAADHGRLWLFPALVHESGRYSFAETLLYFRHFVRELPVTLVYAAASVGAYRAYGPSAAAGRPAPWLARGAAGLGASLVAVAAWATAHRWGARVTLDELLQGYTRDTLYAPGSHWRFHLASTVAYLAFAVALASGLGRALEGSWPRPRPEARLRWLGGTAAAVGALTLVFRPSAEPFVDPRFLGHQAREAVTHLLVTLPLSFAVLLGGAPGPPRTDPRSAAADGGRPSARADGNPGTPSLPREVASALAVGLACVAFLATATIATGAVARARPAARLSSLAAGHVFEHGLDYLLVASLCAALARPPGRPRRVRVGHVR